MKKLSIFFLGLFLMTYHSDVPAQGFTNIWQLGYDAGPLYQKSLIDFNSGQATVDSIIRPMNFSSEEAIICDSNGQILFYTNGIYIANRNHDTLLNGSGLNPGMFTDDWAEFGLPLFQGALILPWPDSSHKYFLIHETIDYNAGVRPSVLYYSIIDMTLDNGLGGVIEKNDTLLSRILDFGGITACKHGNGRDWWVFVHKHLADLFYKILITPIGITTIDSQSVGGPITDYGNEAVFSPDGNWFATFDNLSKLRLYNFDRCSGNLSNLQYFNIVPDSVLAACLSFSPNSNVMYASTLTEVFQFDLLAGNILASQKLIAIFDGYYSPFPPFATTFCWHMLGPDGKIYINSSNSVVDLHMINFPDSLDTLCNLQQHSFHLSGFNDGTLPNHINYWLGPITGSPCDTIVKVRENVFHNFNLTVFPNPLVDGMLRIFYRLPQHKEGDLELFDLNGKRVFSCRLPMWSTQQALKLPKLSAGIYALSITSGGSSMVKKVLIAE